MKAALGVEVDGFLVSSSARPIAFPVRSSRSPTRLYSGISMSSIDAVALLEKLDVECQCLVELFLLFQFDGFLFQLRGVGHQRGKIIRSAPERTARP